MHRSGKAEYHRCKPRVTRPNTHQKRVEKFAHIAGAGLLFLFERCAVEVTHKPVQRVLLQPQTQEQPVLHGAASAGGGGCVLPLEFSCVCHGAPLFKTLFHSVLIS